MTRIKNAQAILGVLFLVNFLNFFDRALPAILLEPMRREFALTDSMIGLLITAFTLVYAIMGIPLGRLADKYPRKYVLAGGVLVWSLMTALCGMVTSFWLFFAMRIGVGVGEASCAPASNSLLASLFPSNKRGKAMGIFMLGLPLGSIAAFAGVGYLAEIYGWRFPFFVAAAPGILVILLLLMIDEPARKPVPQTDASGTQAASPYKTILRRRTVLWLIVSGISFNFVTSSFGAFLGSFFIRFHSLGIAQSGVYCAIILGATGLLGLLVWGPIADKMNQKFKHGRLGLASVAFLIAAPIMWLGLSLDAGNHQMALIIMTIGWLMIFTYFVTVYAALQEVVPPNLVATTMALYFMFMYLLGAAFGASATGYLSDMFSTAAAIDMGLSEVNDLSKAIGLKQALSVVVPTSLILTALAIAGAAKHYAKEKIA